MAMLTWWDVRETGAVAGAMEVGQGVGYWEL